MNLISRSVPFSLCICFGLGLGWWSHLLVQRSDALESITPDGFSTLQGSSLLCKSTDETQVLLTQQNFAKSDWLGISSLGAFTQAWVNVSNGHYLIVRDHPTENKSCFLDTGTLNHHSTHKEP